LQRLLSFLYKFNWSPFHVFLTFQKTFLLKTASYLSSFKNDKIVPFDQFLKELSFSSKPWQVADLRVQQYIFHNHWSLSLLKMYALPRFEIQSYP